MHRVQFVLVVCMAVALSACSVFGSGGKGSADDMGEGNIPIAESGSDLADVHFEFDSAALDGRAQSLLRENSSWLLDNDEQKVVVEGHCDERGTAEYNLALGERRARTVYDFLRSLGVKSEQLNTISYGEELPLDPRSAGDAWAKNRRAHFAFPK